MKNSKLLLLLLIVAVALLGLAACNSACEEHTDADSNGTCDNCGEPVDLTPDDDNTNGDGNTDNGNTDGGNTDGGNDDGNTDGGNNDGGNTDDGNDDGNGDDNTDGGNTTPCETHVDSTLDGTCDTCGEAYTTITVAEALELCGAEGNITTERYYVRATVSTIKNANFGEMYISDSTGEIYVYGTYSFDGVLQFPAIDNTPVRGDEVVLHCILQNFNGTKEVKNARLVGYKHVEADVSDYTEMTVAAAREAADGTLIKLEGVVARITYANGKVPSGFILVDDTQAIYVYGLDAGGTVSIGNKVTVAGVKDYWILDTEVSNAEKFGYLGCNQLSDAIVVENDKRTDNAYNKSWITESTVKEMLATPFTEDVTSTIFKVTALVKKVEGTGFTNYYFNDIDGVTGSYTYTQCSGGDFTWLDQYDGKFCTVYLSLLNAKSTATGCNWRLLPIEVIDEGYKFNTNDAAKYAVKYHGVDQFLTKYTADPALALIGSVSSELLGFENALITYASSDTSVITITSDGNGGYVMNCIGVGTATVTITATYGGNTYSEDVTITYELPVQYDSITVAEAIASEIGTVVTVKGIVGPSIVNKNGFYLIDESGVIAVTGPDAMFDGLSIGNEVILRGTRSNTTATKSVGQIYIANTEILTNDYGKHEYSTATFITDKTAEDFYNLDPMTVQSTNVFVIKATVLVVETPNYTNIQISFINSNNETKTINLYCSSAGQYSWLKAYANQEVTLEVAACNWNDKTYYAGCALAIVHEDGTKTYNTLNFDN